jgi:hypothetical protein
MTIRITEKLKHGLKRLCRIEYHVGKRLAVAILQKVVARDSDLLHVRTSAMLREAIPAATRIADANIVSGRLGTGNPGRRAGTRAPVVRSLRTEVAR